MCTSTAPSVRGTPSAGGTPNWMYRRPMWNSICNLSPNSALPPARTATGAPTAAVSAHGVQSGTEGSCTPSAADRATAEASVMPDAISPCCLSRLALIKSLGSSALTASKEQIGSAVLRRRESAGTHMFADEHPRLCRMCLCSSLSAFFATRTTDTWSSARAAQRKCWVAR